MNECGYPTCKAEPLWTVTAAYPTDRHDEVHTYPVPMVRACSEHLSHVLAQDMMQVGSTMSWLVKPAS